MAEESAGSPTSAADEPSIPSELYGLIKTVLTDPALSPEQKVMLIDEVRKSTPASDRWTSRYAIYSLAAIVLIALIGVITLGMSDKYIPDGLIAIGSAAVGGLAGLLTPRKG
ncbi:hypothetical protein [Pseudomonas sp. Gutcm_11s]|uniref:hypothetical protein n=1 Tax=Pseudomonas sp. Gutcm_11s TaxID=3026088 RepID=UPI00235F9060|nr:hypothetical protein [Pseudomonas sp. Gutcm_11s]MDD0841649.1 hypothetical protein [Pseudomonas sp. Gutcm_11s]